jgi:small-conductance mechanosensitive channel
LAIVALGALARAFAGDTLGTGRLRGIEIRAARYQRTFRTVVIAIICGTAAVMLLQLWGLEALGWFAPGKVGEHLLSAVMTTTIAAALAIVVWEGSNAVLDRQIDRLRETEPARAVRLRTLLPIVRTGLLWTILIVIGATGLSEIGVNIAPLLAGAGIVGIAVGFGAQTLVHDIITGMFILIENTVQVGDGITTAGLTGTVEQLTIRTLRLRAVDGSLHIIPFSSVVTITNSNRSGIGNAAISVTVAPAEDIDRVSATLVAIGRELRADPAFSAMILGDLDLWGVDTVRSWGATLAGQIPCTVDGHMPVQREFNRRMLKRFAELGIALGGPANVAAPA